MTRRIGLGLLLLACAVPGLGQAAARCRPGPLAPALDSVPPLPDARTSSVGFAGTPSLEHPGRAWVVRAYSSRGEATLEILRLRRKDDCNVYEIESRWQAPLPGADYRALLRSAERLGIPRRDFYSNENADGDAIVVVADGTGIELRLERTGWEVRRTLNHFEPGGSAVSSLFHRLVSTHVPADMRPAEDWQTLGR